MEDCPILLAKIHEKGVQPLQLTQNPQMMTVKLREEDPKVNIVLRSGATTAKDKGIQCKEGEWVWKSPKKETGFDLECAKETFMEAKKSFIEASTLGR